MSKRPLVMFSPLPPLRNGIADYTASFVAPLADQYDLYIVISDEAPHSHIPGMTTLSLSEYNHHRSAFAEVGHAYQIGNNLDHVYALAALTERPGLTTIHDLSIQHMIGGSLPGGVVGEPYFELMFEAYGKRGLEVARDVPRWRRQAAVVHGELGLLPIVAKRSRGVVTHSMTGLLRLESCLPSRPVYLIPHHYQNRIDMMAESREERRRQARRKLALADDAIIILSLGFVTRSKRVDLTLEALHILLSSGADFCFVIAGQAHTTEIDLEAEVSRLNLRDKVLIRGYVPDDQMLDYLAACDVLVNLRYPTLGESSGSLTNGLGMGCCALVTDIGTFSELPDTCVVKVPLSEMTAEGVAARLLPAISNQRYRSRLENNARQYAQTNLRTSNFVERYVAAIEDCLFQKTSIQVPSISYRTKTHADSTRRHIEDIAAEIAKEGPVPDGTMWWRELLLPISDGSTLVISGNSFSTHLAQKAFGWECAPYRAADPSSIPASTALIIQNVDNFMKDPIGFLRKVAARLMPGGMLVLNLIDPGETAYGDMASLFGGQSALRPIHAAKRGRLAESCERAGFNLLRQISAFSEITADGADQSKSTEFALVARLGSEQQDEAWANSLEDAE